MMCTMGPSFFPLCALFGAAGVGVLLLTVVTREPVLQRILFWVAGGAGAAAILTLSIFHILVWAGHPPGGDGGGITVPMLLIICPVGFLIGAIGATLCHIGAKIAGAKPGTRSGHCVPCLERARR